MARPHVPKFGNWEASGGNGQAYTAVFDQARAGKGTKFINPNDPQENEALAAQLRGGPPAPAPTRNPPPRYRAAANDSGRGGAEPPPRRAQADRDGDGYNHERLPVHANRPNARETGRGAASPAWDRRARHPSGGDEGSVTGAGAPKARLRPQGGREEPPAKGGALPKFGAWDVKDPNAGDGFTMIFQKLSNEKKEGGPVHIPRLNSDQAPAHEDSSGKQNHQPGAQRNNKHNSNPACCTIL